MTVHVFRAPAGLGKTTLVIEKIRDSGYERVDFYVPTLKLAEEVRQKLEAAAITSIVIHGRDQEGEDGQPLCLKAPLASAVARLGYPVFPVICMGATSPGDKFSHKTCEHLSQCSYLSQFLSKAQVHIYPHAYLPLPRNVREVKQKPPGLIVIDESFLSVCLRTINISRDQLISSTVDFPEAAVVIKQLLQAIDEGGPLLNTLRQMGLTKTQLDAAFEATKSSGASFTPYGSDAELLRYLKKSTPRVRVDIIAQILSSEMATGRSESHGITVDSTGQYIRLHYRMPLTRLSYKDNPPEIVLIDANADADLLRPWFPDIVFSEISVQRNAYVIQCSSIRGSTTSFVPERNSDLSSQTRAAENLAAVNALIDREAKDPSQKILVVGPQAVVGNSRNHVLPLISPPQNVSLAHFNGLRGIDSYKDYDGVIIIGRNQPPIDELENMARALWYDSPTPLRFAKDWVVEIRPYWMRDPTLTDGMEVLVHPDPRIQALHEQIREGESTQAIDRLRLIHAPQRKRVVIVSNIPLAIQVDELQTFKELAYQTRLARAFGALKGTMPLNPAWLAERFPQFWPTLAAAKADLSGRGQKEDFINNISIKNPHLLRLQYRVAGQSRPSDAVSLRPVAQARAELTWLLGRPFAARAIIDGKLGPLEVGSLGHVALAQRTAYGIVQ